MAPGTHDGPGGHESGSFGARIDAAQREPGAAGRVLLVDDDPLVREVYAKVLRKVGCVVKTAASGAAALEILGAGSFDLVVTDITMTGMSGTQFLRAIRERNLDVPVILMTGLPGVETTREAVDYGAFRYLTKPVVFDTLAQAARTAIYMHIVARVVAEHVPFLDACLRIARAVCQGSDWDVASIWAPGDGDRMRCAGTWARPGDDVAAFEEAMKTVEVEVAVAFARKGWSCDSPDWIPDICADPQTPQARFAVVAGFRSSFSVPIGTEGEVFAVLEFFSRTYRGPDLNLLEMIATSGARLSAQALSQRAEQRALRAELAQKAIKVTLDAVLECAPSVILAVDEHGKIQFINKVLPHQRMVDLIGSDWLQHVLPGDDDRHRERLRRVLATGVAETYEAIVVGARGGAFSFTIHIGPLRDNHRVVGAVVVAQDVSDLRRSQAAVASARQLAAVGSLAAGVAHDIDAPVQAVDDTVRFLRDATRDILRVTDKVTDKLQEVRRLAADGPTAPGLAEAIAASVCAEEEADLAQLREAVANAFERCIDGTTRITSIVRSMRELAHPDPRS